MKAYGNRGQKAPEVDQEAEEARKASVISGLLVPVEPVEA